MNPQAGSTLEGLFGQGLGAVRVHRGARLDPHLLAYAAGEHVVLGDAVDRLSPARSAAVLAHEVAHVVQQRRGGPERPDAAGLEADANSAAVATVHGRPAAVTGAGPVAVQLLSIAEARGKLWGAVPDALKPTLAPLAGQASAALDKVVPAATQLPAAVTAVVDSAASGAQAVKAAAAPAVAAVRTAAANPTVAAAARSGLGKARDVANRSLGRSKAVALEVTNVVDVLIWLPHAGREVAKTAVDDAVLTGAISPERAQQARALIADVSRNYGAAIGFAAKHGIVEIDDVTGTPSLSMAVAGVFDSGAAKLDQAAAAAGAVPEQALVFTEYEIAELETALGISVLLSVVGAKEVEVALKLLGALGAIKSLMDLVERGGWVNDVQFWLRLIGVFGAVLGLRNNAAWGKITRIVVKLGGLAGAAAPIYQLYLDWKDPKLAAGDPARRRAVLHRDLKDVAHVVLNVLNDAVHHGMSVRAPTPRSGPGTPSGPAAAGPGPAGRPVSGPAEPVQAPARTTQAVRSTSALPDVEPGTPAPAAPRRAPVPPQAPAATLPEPALPGPGRPRLPLGGTAANDNAIVPHATALVGPVNLKRGRAANDSTPLAAGSAKPTRVGPINLKRSTAANDDAELRSPARAAQPVAMTGIDDTGYTAPHEPNLPLVPASEADPRIGSTAAAGPTASATPPGAAPTRPAAAAGSGSSTIGAAIRGGGGGPKPPASRAGSLPKGRPPLRGATAEGVGEEFGYEYHDPVKTPTVVRRPTPPGVARPPAEAEPPAPKSGVGLRNDETPEPQPDTSAPPRLPMAIGSLDSAEAARQAGIPSTVIGDAWVFTEHDFPDLSPNRPLRGARRAPAAKPEQGRTVGAPRLARAARAQGRLLLQDSEWQGDLILIRDELAKSGATLNVKVNQQQEGPEGTRVGANRPDLQLAVVTGTVQGRRIHIEYDRAPGDRSMDHARRILTNDPTAIVILKIVDWPTRR